MRLGIARDHRKLKVFAQADVLVLEVYERTATFPVEERYGLCAQIRRAAVSVPTNIVEGSARRTSGEYLNGINIAMVSAAETLYLLNLSSRLGFLSEQYLQHFDERSNALLAGLQKLQHSLRGDSPSSKTAAGPGAQSR
jgi:four helix bundle protein